MYAIIETGGKQFRVEEGSEIVVEKISAEAGTDLTMDKVLLIGGDHFSVGSPYVEGASVIAEVLKHGQGEKIIVYKKRRRHDSHRKMGHRQELTTLKIKSVQALQGAIPPLQG